MIETKTLLICAIAGLAYGFWAFANACYILPRMWQSVLVGVVICTVTAISVRYEIMAILAILTIVLPITTIILTFIGKKG